MPSNDSKPTLLSFATREEAKAIKALASFSTAKEAATSLGITRGALRDRVRRAEKRAASRGFAPELGWTHPVPEGHRIKGNSTLRGPGGEVQGQWIKSERDSDDPPAFQAVPEG